MLMFRIVVAAFLLAALARPSFAHVTGTATVIDGDTIVVAGAGIWRGEFTPPWEWRAARH
jgi:endonuclease YncB( thermonuclease family)